MSQMLFRPLRQIADKFNQLQMGIVSEHRVFKVMDTLSFISREGSYKAEKMRGDISFRNPALLRFLWLLRYRDRTRPSDGFSTNRKFQASSNINESSIPLETVARNHSHLVSRLHLLLSTSKTDRHLDPSKHPDNVRDLRSLAWTDLELRLVGSS